MPWLNDMQSAFLISWMFPMTQHFGNNLFPVNNGYTLNICF